MAQKLVETVELTTLFSAEADRSSEGEKARNVASLRVAKVIACREGGEIDVDCDGDRVQARRGFACLVQPAACDRVLMAETPQGSYVITVLERLIPDSAALSLANGGAIAIEASRLALRAETTLSLDAPSISLVARACKCAVDAATWIGKTSNTIFDRVTNFAKTQETVADVVSVHAVDRVSIIDRADVLRAESLSQTIESATVTSAPIAVIAATEDLRLDGQRVTVG
jgi:hypothetical protein